MNITEALREINNSYVYWAECAKLDFSDRIFDLMEQQSLSKSDLARAMGVTPAYITKILGGDANLSIESMSKLAYAMGKKVNICLAQIETAQSTITGNCAISKPVSEHREWAEPGNAAATTLKGDIYVNTIFDIAA